MKLNTIQREGQWSNIADKLNENFSKVDNAVEALNQATIKNIGYFSTADALREAYPIASAGAKAYVGTIFPFAIYLWDVASSTWADSGETGGEESVNLGDCYTKEEVDSKFANIITDVDNKFDKTSAETYFKQVDDAIEEQQQEIAEFKEAVTDQVENYKPIVINGDVANAADEEDITSENGLLKFADRSALNGMGYVILRKDKTIEEQIVETNTIYEIRYDFDLNSKEIIIPNACVLKFNGGSLRNGVIKGNETVINAISSTPIFVNIVLNGNFHSTSNISYIKWFSPIANGIANDTQSFNNLACFDGRCELENNKTYLVDSWIVVGNSTEWNLNNSTIKMIDHRNISIFLIKNVDNVKIYNGRIVGAGVIAESNIEYGITINASSNVVLQDLYISAFSRDGIYIGYEWTDVSEQRQRLTENILVTNCVIDAVGRNGISLTSGNDVTIENTIFRNITKIPPTSGIDIEPESSSKDSYLHINNIRVHDCIFENCNNSIEIYLADFNYAKGSIFINDIYCINKGNVYIGASIAYGKGADVFVDGVTFNNPDYNAITIINPSILYEVSFKNVRFCGELIRQGWEYTTAGAISVFTQKRIDSTVTRSDLGGVFISDIYCQLKPNSPKFKYLISLAHQTDYETGIVYESVKASNIVIENIFSQPQDSVNTNLYNIDTNNVDYNTLTISNPLIQYVSINPQEWKRIGVITYYTASLDFNIKSRFKETADQIVSGNAFITYYGGGIKYNTHTAVTPIDRLRIVKDNTDGFYYLEVYNSSNSTIYLEVSLSPAAVDADKIICIDMPSKNDNTSVIKQVAVPYLVGDSGKRPALAYADRGYQYYDVALNKPIWWTGTKWIDATGAEV